MKYSKVAWVLTCILPCLYSKDKGLLESLLASSLARIQVFKGGLSRAGTEEGVQFR